MLSFPASDEHLFSLNGALPVADEEGAEPTVSEAGQVFKSRLAAHRSATSNFGLRPPKPEAPPSEEAPLSEEKKEGDAGAEDAGAEGEDVDTVAAENKNAKSLVEWLEVKFPGCKR